MKYLKCRAEVIYQLFAKILPSIFHHVRYIIALIKLICEHCNTIAAILLVLQITTNETVGKTL